MVSVRDIETIFHDHVSTILYLEGWKELDVPEINIEEKKEGKKKIIIVFVNRISRQPWKPCNSVNAFTHAFQP